MQRPSSSPANQFFFFIEYVIFVIEKSEASKGQPQNRSGDDVIPWALDVCICA